MPKKGRVVGSYVVECAEVDCPNWDEYVANHRLITRADAERQFQQRGWQQRSGRWDEDRAALEHERSTDA